MRQLEFPFITVFKYDDEEFVVKRQIINLKWVNKRFRRFLILINHLKNYETV